MYYPWAPFARHGVRRVGTIFKPRRVKVLKPFTSADHYTLQFIRRHDGLEGYPHPYSLNKVLVFNCLETWRALKPSRQTASPQNPLWKVLRQGFQRHAGLLVRFDFASSFTLFHCAPRKRNYLQNCRHEFAGIAANSPVIYGRAFFAFHELRERHWTQRAYWVPAQINN